MSPSCSVLLRFRAHPLRTRQRLALTTCAILYCVLSAAHPARAQAPGEVDAASASETHERRRGRRHRLALPEGTPRASVAEVITTGAFVGGLLGVRAIGYPAEPGWTRVNRMDGFLRGRLRLGSGGGRDRIGAASDALFMLTSAYPVVVEDLTLVLIGDRNPRLAAELLAVDAQAYALTGLLVGIAKVAGARARPYAHGAQCAEDPSAPECAGHSRNMSFFSGHTAMAFTGAGLTCFHQQRLPELYGSRAAGRAVCATALTAASLTGTFRVMSDNHWASDVLLGAGVGLVSGWLLPHLSRGRAILPLGGERVKGTLVPTASADGIGLTYDARF